MTQLYTVKADRIREVVLELTTRASTILSPGLKQIIKDAKNSETEPLAVQALGDILTNAELAAEKNMPICQDCGLAVVFVEIGQHLHVIGGDIVDAINEGVRQAYTNGYLRKSVVVDPVFNRTNTRDNTPAVIHWNIVPGHDIKITVSPKGMGSENMSRVHMLKPADGAEGIIDTVVQTVKDAGPNPCPPVILGIGIGGNFESVALAAKRALLKENGERHPDRLYAEMEETILRKINELGIGPGGYGGKTTALDVHIETLPTHIAGMPLAINICCHALRHAEGTINGELNND